jgi:hypothetical protein
MESNDINFSGISGGKEITYAETAIAALTWE